MTNPERESQIIEAIVEVYASHKGNGMPTSKDIYEAAGMPSSTYYRLRESPGVRAALAAASATRRATRQASVLQQLDGVTAQRDELLNVVANLAVAIHQRDLQIESLHARLKRNVRHISAVP